MMVTDSIILSVKRTTTTNSIATTCRIRSVKCVLHKFPFLESSETSKIIPKSKLLFIYNSYYITYFYLYYTNLLFIYIYIILHNIISIFIIHILRKFEILIFER